MSKLATLRLLDGNLEQGVQVVLTIAALQPSEGSISQGFQTEHPGAKPDISGTLPPNDRLVNTIKQWQYNYRSLGSLGSTTRMQPNGIIIDASIPQLRSACQELDRELRSQLNDWLSSSLFSPIRDKWLEELTKDEVRVLVRASNQSLLEIPWHLWDLVERNPRAEVALSCVDGESVVTPQVPTLRGKVRILAILGNRENIKVEKDQELLEQLPDAELVFLDEPKRKDINDELWDQNWDILYFAGHSRTEGEKGRIYINKTDSLTLKQLKYALEKAVSKGLKLAIFNSCDGMGLGFELQQLHLPQAIVMREPVPDEIAQDFLRHFLPEFAGGQSLYLAEREARLRLHGREDEFPGASWLPVIFQSPATTPPTWADLGRRATTLCPYRGLFAFREEDALFFQGRKSFTQTLVEAVQRQNLVSVIGASGSGKSSVVFAGLVAELRQQGSWEIVAFRPGQRPFQAIAAAWVTLRSTNQPQAEQLQSVLQLAEAWRTDEVALYTAMKEAVWKSPGTKVLLVVDQFEELYTQCQDTQEPQAFIACLLKVVELTNIALVLTLRADFLGQALAYPPLANVLSDSDRMLGAMSREELQSAIAQPAALLGVTLEEGLTDRMIEAVSYSEGNLPLLEFALQELWEKRQGTQLTHAAYDEIGGLETAVAHRMEKAYSRLSDSEKEQSRQIFLQLVRPGQGSMDTRRVATRTEIGDENWVLVTRLASDRLVVTGLDAISQTETVELVHEALISKWSRLREWIDENRDFRLWQERVRDTIHQWDKSDQDEGALLRGKSLIDAEDWLQKRSEELTVEQEFIKASVRKREQQRKIRKIIGTTIVLLSSLITVISLYQLNQARKGQIEALNTSSQNSLLANDQLGSLVASVKAAKLLNMVLDQKDLQDRTLETFEQAVYAVHEQNRLKDDDWIQDVDFSPDNKKIITAGDNHKIKLWKIDGAYIKTLGEHDDRIYSANFSLDGQKIVSASRDQTIKIWSGDGKLLKTIQKAHDGRIKWVRFSLGSTTIASASYDRTVKLWNPQGQLLQTLKGHTRDVESVSFGPDGSTLVSGGLDGKIILWSSKGKLKQQWKGHQGGVFSTVFSPDGKVVATAGNDSRIKLWDLTGRLLKTLEGHTGGVNSVCFSPDGQMLASASRDKSVKLWNRDGVLIATFKGHMNEVTKVKFSPNGQTLASASWDKSVKLWDIHNNKNLLEGWSFIPMLQPQDAESRSVSYSPNGEMIASSNNDGIAKIWDQTGNLIRELRGHTGPVRKVVFSPDSKSIATGGDDEIVILWNSKTGKRLKKLKGHRNRISGINFSADSKMVSSTGDDRIIRIWKVADGSLIKEIPGHQDFVVDVTFSPDGKTIVTASDDKTMRLWNLNGKPLKTLNHNDEVNSVSFSPDGKMLVTASDDKQVRLQALDVREASENFKNDDREMVARFSPDGSMIASAGFDKKVKLRKLDGTLLNIFDRHEDFIWDVSFSPDSKMIVSSSSDKTIKVWPVDKKEDTSVQLNQLLQRGCKKLADYVKNSSSSREEDRHLCDKM